MIALSSIPTPVWLVLWIGAGLCLTRMPPAWSLILGAPLAGLILLVHAGLARRPSPEQARTYPLRRLAGADYLWVFGTAVLVVALTLTSTLTRVTLGKPVPAGEYSRAYQTSLGLALLFGPVVCEMFFRGWLLGRLRRPDGLVTWKSMLVSAFLFGLVARFLSLTGPLGTLPSAIALGLSAAILVSRTGSLLAPMLLHALHNGSLMFVAWYAQGWLLPLLGDRSPVSVAFAVAMEVFAVLAWALVMNRLWNRAAPNGGGDLKSGSRAGLTSVA
jgi:membrane protease YdiL (CAAX protease family)